MLRTVNPGSAASCSIVSGWAGGGPDTSPLNDVTSFAVTVYAVMLLMGTVETAPAGGAAATQVLVGGLVSALIMGAVVTLGLAHRSGRTDLLDRAAAPLKRVFA